MAKAKRTAEANVTLAVPATKLMFAAAIDQTEVTADRTVSARILPFGDVGDNGNRWVFAPGSVHVPAEVRRVKLLADHDSGNLRSLLGAAVSITEQEDGLYGVFRFADTEPANHAIALIKSGILDGVSVGLSFGENVEAEYNSDMDIFFVTSGAILRETSLVSIPAFDDARVEGITASAATVNDETFTTMKKEALMGKDQGTTPANDNITVNVEAPDFSGLTDSLTEAFAAAIAANAPAAPAPAPVTSNTVTAPRPVYGSGSAHSFVRDAWAAKFSEGAAQEDARARVRTINFATESTTSQPATVLPTVAYDMYLAGDTHTRPLYTAFSKGPAVTGTTAFQIPSFGSAANLTRDHVEGVNSVEGQITTTSQTIQPVTIDGLFKVTRELIESSNPQVDEIARQEMSKSYDERIESKLAARLAAVSAVVANVAVSGQGAAYLDALTLKLGTQLFRKGGSNIDRIVVGQDAYLASLAAKDANGQRLVGRVAPLDQGAGSATTPIISYEGMSLVPAWPLATNTTVAFASRSAWTWDSPVKQFRFEERGGPSIVELALFGYHADAFLRTSDLERITFTLV